MGIGSVEPIPHLPSTATTSLLNGTLRRHFVWSRSSTGAAFLPWPYIYIQLLFFEISEEGQDTGNRVYACVIPLFNDLELVAVSWCRRVSPNAARGGYCWAHTKKRPSYALPLFGFPSTSAPTTRAYRGKRGRLGASNKQQADDAHLFVSGESSSALTFPPPPYRMQKAGTRPDHDSSSNKFRYADSVKPLGT